MGQAGTGKRSAGTGLAPCAEGGKGSVHSLTIKVGGSLGWIELHRRPFLFVYQFLVKLDLTLLTDCLLMVR